MTDLEAAMYDELVFGKPIPQYLKEQAKAEALADEIEEEYYGKPDDIDYCGGNRG